MKQKRQPCEDLRENTSDGGNNKSKGPEARRAGPLQSQYDQYGQPRGVRGKEVGYRLWRQLAAESSRVSWAIKEFGFDSQGDGKSLEGFEMECVEIYFIFQKITLAVVWKIMR